MKKNVEKYLVLADKDVESKKIVEAVVTIGETRKNMDINVLTHDEIVNKADDERVVHLLASSDKFIVVNNIDQNCYGYLSDEMYDLILGLQKDLNKKFYYRYHMPTASLVSDWTIPIYGSDMLRYNAEHLNTARKVR